MSTDDEGDRIFKALASPTRRAILDALTGGPRTTGDLCAAFPAFDRCTVMQHLKVLEGADLVVARREGRERWNHLNALPIKRIHDRWIGPYATRAVAMLDRLATDLGD
ncbi:DNA-binding transcriptional ArsR family regulator [Stella humosa]|uniref:DNA-binding transcriptional ArsR family regulator n=1 Tax=Stella humosa TaxID=94 RepID=A0A3N1KZG2_9PROT|nr:metalloregulator ArsR/SmtB family transcription factor [Stella humosa]ROP83708.1 DNA-binding transcriptional ArsR family regulator [Stella humosa]BBK33020.1 transcriptional regulator [Stella humosa]